MAFICYVYSILCTYEYVHIYCICYTIQFLHIQCDIHVTYLLLHFIFCIIALSAIMSEWGIPVMPFKIFENNIFKVLVLFCSSEIRNTDHHFLICKKPVPLLFLSLFKNNVFYILLVLVRKVPVSQLHNNSLLSSTEQNVQQLSTNRGRVLKNKHNTVYFPWTSVIRIHIHVSPDPDLLFF